LRKKCTKRLKGKSRKGWKGCEKVKIAKTRKELIITEVNKETTEEREGRVIERKRGTKKNGKKEMILMSVKWNLCNDCKSMITKKGENDGKQVKRKQKENDEQWEKAQVGIKLFGETQNFFRRGWDLNKKR
jgi:hypothetical protein